MPEAVMVQTCFRCGAPDPQHLGPKLTRCVGCGMVTGDLDAMLERARQQEDERRLEATRR